MAFIDDDDFGGDHRQRFIRRFPNFHHSAPLVYYPQRHIVDLYNGSTTVKSIPMFRDCLGKIEKVNSIKGGRLKLSDDPSVFYSRLLKGTYESLPSPDDDLEKRLLLNALNVCIRETKRDLEAISSTNPALTAITKHASFDQHHIESIVKDVGECFVLYRKLTRKRNEIQRAHVYGNHEELSDPFQVCGFECYSFREMMLVVDTHVDRQAYLLNYDQFLMMTDVVASRFTVRTACCLNAITRHDDLPSPDLLLRVYTWGDRILEKHGVVGYSIIGEYESIATNVFVNFPGSDPLGLGYPFFEALLQGAHEIEDEYGVPASHATDLINIFSDVTSPNQLSELFGLRKHWGNPMVDARASGRAVQEKIMEDLPVDGCALLNLHASFNRMITLEFIKKTGRWPDCSFPENISGSVLYKCWSSGITRIPETTHGHKHVDWSLLKFNQNCVLDAYKDQLSLLSDKSVSPYRKNVLSIFVNALLNHPLPTRPKEERRIMLEFLREEHPSIVEILKTVMTGSVPFDWLCNVASLKGTEMKHNKARIFAVLTYELRQYFVVTEDMIKTHIFPYNPHQTMTMNEIDLLSKLKGLTSQLQLESSERHLSVIHIIDFSKWNLRMRYENTSVVFKSIDDFLGTPNLIEMTHKIFEQLLNVVQDPFNPPEGDIERTASDTVWQLHTCGWEGQRQKGWTVVTSALLSYLELVTGVHSEICGQGDNQIMLSKFSVPSQYISAKEWVLKDGDGVRARLNNFYSVLESECLKVGLKVKSAESCRSLCYLNYGKRLYFNGVELSMTLKRISRMITEPNDPYPSTESRLKTLEGSIYAANLFGHPNILSYLMSRLGVFLTLDETFRYNPLIGNKAMEIFSHYGVRYSSSFIATVMKIPAGLGGPPQQPFSAYLCRGHPDSLCTDLVMLTLRAESGDITSKRLIMLLEDDSLFAEGTDKKDALIASPFSLNLKVPLSAKKPMERRVLQAIKTYCKNKTIKSLFTSTMDAHESELIKSLSSMEPFNPLVANDIYSRSAPGRRQAFVSGLCNSTSLSRLVQEEASCPLIEDVCRLEFDQLVHWVNLFNQLRNIPSIENLVIPSHHALAQDLRDRSWNTEINGVTVPHPLGLFIMCESEWDRCSSSCTEGIDEHLVILQHNESLICLDSGENIDTVVTRSATCSPYLGNVINEGLTQSDIVCLTPDATWIDLLRLNVIKKWVCEEGSNLHQLLDIIIRSRTDVPLDYVDRATGRPSRLSYNHRAALMGTVRSCAPSTTTNVHTRFYVSSNRMGQYSHGENNYHLAFGPSFLVAQALLSLEFVIRDVRDGRNAHSRNVFHYHLKTGEIPVVYDGTLEVYDTSVTRRREMTVPDMVFCKFNDLEFDVDIGARSSMIWMNEDCLSETNERLMYAYQLVTASFIAEITYKELHSANTLTYYPPRNTPVSIGDINIVSVDLFCKALACQCLFFIPLEDLCESRDSVIFHNMFKFVSSLSMGFWKNYCSSMSAPKHTKRLTQLSRPLNHRYTTQKASGIVPLLQMVVAEFMVQVWKNLRTCVLSEENTPDLILAAPSVTALKTVVSRYFELCLVSLFDYSKVPKGRLLSYGRDIVANVHTATESTFPHVLLMCKSQFKGISKEVLLFVGKRVPDPVILSLNYPWIDRIREYETEVVEHENSQHDVIHMENRFFFRRSYINPLFVTWVNTEVCECEPWVLPAQLQWQSYYQPAGTLSKNAYIVAEIIYTYTLPIKKVGFFGSRTGSEAAVVTLDPRNERVYVSGFRNISDFSPHMAASYHPPAFNLEGIKSKLVSPSSSALCVNDLVSDDCVLSLHSQIRSEELEGLWVDLSMMQGDKKLTEMNVLASNNVIKICNMVNSISWLCLRVQLVCTHNIHKILSEAARTFIELDLIYSHFTPAGSMIGLILCRKRKPVESAFNNLKKVAAHLDDAHTWHSLFKHLERSSIPACFQLPHTAMVVKMNQCSRTLASFQSACVHYLPGFGKNYKYTPFPATVIDDLKGINQSMDLALKRLLETAFKVSEGFQMVRAGVMGLRGLNVSPQAEKICGAKQRAQLLLDLLELEGELSFFELRDFIAKRMSEPYWVTVLKLEYTMDQDEFIRVYSRALFEILGVLKAHQEIHIDHPSDFVYHTRKGEAAHLRFTYPEILEIPLTNCIFYTDNFWRWDRRSFYLAIFLCKQEFTEYKVRVDTNLEHLIDEGIVRSLKLEDVIYEDTSSNDPILDLIVVDDDFDPSELGCISSPVGIICHTHRYGLYAALYNITFACALPWSGVYPSRILVIIFPGHGEGSEGLKKVIDVVAIGGRCSSEGLKLIGCSCYSCTVEVSLSDKYEFSSATLNRVCSQDSKSSVWTKFHRRHGSVF